MADAEAADVTTRRHQVAALEAFHALADWRAKKGGYRLRSQEDPMVRPALPCLLCVLQLLSCCGEHQGSPDASVVRSAPAAAPPPAPVPDWREAHDFDGDGQRDSIRDEFTEGGHCCYRLAVALSSTGETVQLPFQMDGGYVGGLDLSQPDQFFIRTPDDALPELVMEIETYNGLPQPLNPTWRRRYGFRTHRVAVCFPSGKVRVRDFVPELAPCVKDIQGLAR